MTSQASASHYTLPSDEALAVRAQSGDQRAVGELIERYRPFVTGVASHYFGASLERDDIVQEGLIGLLSSIYSYSAGKNASFRTYSAVCVTNAIRAAVKAAAGKKHFPLNSSVPLDDLTLSVNDSPERIVLSDEKAVFINRFISERLSPLERAVLKQHLKGADYRTAGAALGITEKAVDNALQRARGKLSKALREF